MQTAIADLRQEHEAILSALDTLDRMEACLVAGVPVAPDEVSALLDWLRDFGDRCHHGKEEQLLFPAMVSAGVPERGGPVGVMLTEHELGRAQVRAMEAALRPDLDVRAFSAAARRYSALLRAHIAKENNVLFPMAERVLGELEWHALDEAFAQHEAKALAAGRPDALRGALDAIAAKYA
jgi:hemerythrin-like domain-containing protein